MNTSNYELQPLNPSVADELRSTGGIVYVSDAKPGYPCRQCLRDAEIGEEVLLVSHDPFSKDTPYRSASPIFIHLAPCQPHTVVEIPEQLILRQLSVRAFDNQAMMTNAEVIDGNQLHETLNEMFTDPLVTVLHVHNAVRGCWAVNAIRREEPVRV